MKKILLLTANPRDTGRLGLPQEVRQIEESLRSSVEGKGYEVISRWAVRTKDLRKALLDLRDDPAIVHFSGHGAGEEGLILEDEQGKSKYVSGEALAGLFKQFRNIECVILNACSSVVQATEISKYIPTVISMRQTITDRAAISFSEGFYDGLGYGKSYAEAFELGLSALDLDNIPGSFIPQLQQRDSNVRRPGQQQSQKVFISYKRDAEVDAAIARRLLKDLEPDNSVFIDQTMLVGTSWAERIEDEIRRSDAVIVLLSEASVQSEMIELEVRLAQQYAQAQAGRPKLMPVRVAYYEQFQYPLSEYLDPINWAFWENPSDTDGLVNELAAALAGGELSVTGEAAKKELLQKNKKKEIRLEKPHGTMRPDSRFYIIRDADEKAINYIQDQGGITVIKAPRQTGKSSLLLRALNQGDKKFIFLDFQLLDKATLSNPDIFYRRFCSWIGARLRLPDRVEEFWQKHESHSYPLRCQFYMEDYVLRELDEPLVIAMDEVETIFGTDFRSDFFGMLRSWYNYRAVDPMLWRQIDFALVTSTEPYLFIENQEQSPFNVAEEIELSDFTFEQVCELNQMHGSPLNISQEKKLMNLLNGHPYLVRRALYLIASEQISASNLFQEAISEHGPFRDHLRYYLFRLSKDNELVVAFLKIISEQKCLNENLFFRLHSSGLVRRKGKLSVPRCQLYSNYFWEHLHG